MMRLQLIATIAILLQGSAAAETILVPEDFASIQGAIEWASNYDEIVVGPGTYLEALNLRGKTLTIRSSNGRDETTIEAGIGGTPAVTFETNEPPMTLLDGFTINGGNGASGMRIASASPTIRNCRFEFSDSGSQGGGGIFVQGSPLIEDCVFRNNRAQGIGRGGGLRLTAGNATVLRCDFDSNTGSHGGGVSADGGTHVLRDCVFTNNHANNEGGGCYVSSGSLSLIGCVIQENDAADVGGGVYAGACVQMTECEISGNLADTRGGGFYNASTNCSVIGECTIADNGAEAGGGVFAQGPLLVRNTLFHGNFAQTNGGGLYDDSAQSSVINCSFGNNTAISGKGGGLYLLLSSLSAANCVLWENTDVGGTDGSAQIHVDGGMPVVSYSCVQGGWPGPGDGNIETDPMFVDPVSGDFRLLAGSPCIDAGDNGAVPKKTTTDLDGNPRFVDDPDTPDTGIGDPPIVDMGAFEFQPPPCDQDLDGDKMVGFSDLILVLTAWGECEDCPEDFDDDGSVGFGDILGLLKAWGPCP